MDNKKIQEKLTEHRRMLKVRDFITDFAVLSVFVLILMAVWVVVE